TDEEKDVEQEIKQVTVDADEIAKEIEKLIFDDVVKNRRLKHDASRQDYQFARYVDDKLMGREHELGINVVTPFYDLKGNTEAARMRTLSRDELAVVLNDDDRFVSDLLTYKRTLKYIRQTRTEAAPARLRILTEKGEQATGRERDLAGCARTLVA